MELVTYVGAAVTEIATLRAELSEPQSAEETATMTVLATTCAGEPDIPAGLTPSQYRRSRPRRISLLGAAVRHFRGA